MAKFDTYDRGEYRRGVREGTPLLAQQAEFAEQYLLIRISHFSTLVFVKKFVSEKMSAGVCSCPLVSAHVPFKSLMYPVAKKPVLNWRHERNLQ
jgi:hypothetical protein